MARPNGAARKACALCAILAWGAAGAAPLSGQQGVGETRGKGAGDTAAVGAAATDAAVAGTGDARRATTTDGSPATPEQRDADRNTVGAMGPSTLVYPPWNHTYGIHKARTPHLKLFLGGRTVFSNPQGLAAVKLAQDDDPKIRGDDFQLTVFGLNAGRGEIIYNSSMQTLAMYGTHGAGEGQFDDPHGIAADVNGNVYVADGGNRRVAHLVWRNRQLAWKEPLPGDYREPWGVAVAPPGDAIYVSDHLGNQVYRWTPSGGSAEGEHGAEAPPPATAARGAKAARSDSAGPENEHRGQAGGGDERGALVPLFPHGIERPTALAVTDRDEDWLSPHEDALYVVYEDGAKLGKFDRQGRLVASTAAAERDSIRATPRFAYLAVDFYGNVWVTDTGNGTIYKFKRDLSYLTRYGDYGEGDYQLAEPRGIAIWKRFGQVLVAEREGAQYFFVGTDVLVPDGPLPIRIAGAGPEKRYVLDAFFTEPTELSIAFLSADGAVVDSLAPAVTVDSGRQRVTLDAADLAPDLAARAVRVVLEPRPTYSSRKRFHRRIERPIAWMTSTAVGDSIR